MNSRERLRRCYFNEPLDRPGIYSRPYFPEPDPSYDRLKAYLRQHTEMKTHYGTGFLVSRPPTEHSTEPYSEDFERHITVLHTPAGDLRSTRLDGLKSNPGLHETYLLKDRADAEKFLSLPMPEIGGDVSGFFTRDEEIAEGGIVDVDLSPNPASRTVEMIGSETFAMMTVTDRDILHALCAREQAIVLKKLKFLIDHGVGPYFSLEGQEYLVPPMHGPADFDDFNARYDKPIIDMIHEAGGRVHVHCHGYVKPVFHLILAMGVDVLHPFEGPPMTDMTAGEAKALARGKLCLEGNIQINHMYEHSPEQVRAETEELIRDAFTDHKGLIVCPSASAYIFGAGDSCFGQYKAMIDTVLAWRD